MSEYPYLVICPIRGEQCVNNHKPNDDVGYRPYRDLNGNNYAERFCAFSDNGDCLIYELLKTMRERRGQGR